MHVHICVRISNLNTARRSKRQHIWSSAQLKPMYFFLRGLILTDFLFRHQNSCSYVRRAWWAQTRVWIIWGDISQWGQNIFDEPGSQIREQHHPGARVTSPQHSESAHCYFIFTCHISVLINFTYAYVWKMCVFLSINASTTLFIISFALFWAL